MNVDKKVLSARRVLQELPEEQHALLTELFTKEQSAHAVWQRWTSRFDPSAYSFGTTRMLPYIACRMRQEGKVPSDARLDELYRTCVAKALLLLDSSLKVVQKMQRRGLEPIAMKGLVLLQYYSSIGCRPMGDVDIYVSPKELPSALTLLEQEGFYENELGWSLKNGLEYHHSVLFCHDNGAAIDLHWNTVNECPQQAVDVLYFSELRDICVDGVRMRASSPNALFCHVCINGVRPAPDPSVYWVIDALSVGEGEKWQLDWNYIAELAQATACLSYYQEALEYLSQFAQNKIPEEAQRAILKQKPRRLELLRVMIEKKSVGGERTGGLILRAYDYYRTNESCGVIRDSVGFVLYLRDYWQLSSVMLVPWRMLTIVCKNLVRR